MQMCDDLTSHVQHELLPFIGTGWIVHVMIIVLSFYCMD